MDCEEWRPCQFPNYEISNLGRFRRSTPGRKTEAGKILKQLKLKIGYMIVQPVINGKNCQRYVHHLVAEAFIGKRPGRLVINHKDGDKTNNSLSNLEYITHAENIQHAVSFGLLNAKTTHPELIVTKCRELRSSGLSYSRIAAQCGMSIGHAWNICNGKIRKGTP